MWLSQEKSKDGVHINVLDFMQDEYPMTYILSARGDGKTISSIAQNLVRCFNAGTQFLYMRRFDTDIERLGLNLAVVSDLVGKPVSREKVHLPNGMTNDALVIEGQPICLLVSLNSVAKTKSNDFSLVDLVIYDEFIDLQKKYIKNEVYLFLQFMSTVFRDYSKYRVLMLANSTDLYNKYFLEFEIMPTGRVTKFRDLGIKIVMYESTSKMKSSRENSTLGKQIRFKEGDHSSTLDNEFDNKFDDFLESKLPKYAKQQAVLFLNGEVFGLWSYNEKMYVTQKVDALFPTKYALTTDDLRNGRQLIRIDVLNLMRENMGKGRLRFDNAKTRTYMIEFLLRHGLSGGVIR